MGLIHHHPGSLAPGNPFPEVFPMSYPFPPATWWRPAVWVAAAGLALLLAVAGLILHQHRLATAAGTRAAAAEAREQAAVRGALNATARASLDRQESARLAEENQHLQAALRARPRPPRPVPAPVEDPALAQGLQQAGLREGLTVVRSEGASSLVREDASLVWDWSQQAGRVPALELRLDAAEHLVEGQAAETGALKTEVKDLDLAATTWQETYRAGQERNQALQDQVRAVLRVNTGLKVGAVVLITYEVVKALVRR